jgi:hypothetical protein
MLLIDATVEFEELQLTVAVISTRSPDEKCPVAFS